MIRLVLVILFSIFLRYVVPLKVRDMLTPWAFAVLVVGMAINEFIGSLLVYYASTFAMFVSKAFLLNGFKAHRGGGGKSIPLHFLILYAGWMILGAFGSNFKMLGISYVVNWLVLVVLVGYYTGTWILAGPGRWQKVARACVILTSFFLLLSVSHGGLNVAAIADNGGRTGFNVDASKGAGLNVNGAALLMVGMLLCPALFVFMRDSGRWRIVLKALAIVVNLLLLIMIIRTGARNAMLGVIPLGIFLVGGRNGIKLWLRLAIIVLASLSMVFLIHRYVGKNVEIRSFDFSADFEKGFDSDYFGSGRMGLWRDLTWDMTPMEKIFGAAPPVEILGNTPHIRNCHCMYVNIYVQSGLVGLALIFLFYASAVIFRRWMSLEYRGLALTFITVWILTGLGESANLAASSNISYFLGVGIAYCRFCPRRIIYQSFMPVGGNPYGGVR